MVAASGPAPAGPDARRRRPGGRPFRGAAVYEPLPLYAIPQWSIPEERWESTIDPGEGDYDEERLRAAAAELWLDGRQLTIGGYGDQATSGVGNMADAPSDESLLAQLYITDDLVDADFGGAELVIVSFFIATEDLAARRFDRTRFSA